MREPAEERRRQGGREPWGADQRRRQALMPYEVQAGLQVSGGVGATGATGDI